MRHWLSCQLLPLSPWAMVLPIMHHPAGMMATFGTGTVRNWNCSSNCKLQPEILSYLPKNVMLGIHPCDDWNPNVADSRTLCKNKLLEILWLAVLTVDTLCNVKRTHSTITACSPMLSWSPKSKGRLPWLWHYFAPKSKKSTKGEFKPISGLEGVGSMDFLFFKKSWR